MGISPQISTRASRGKLDTIRHEYANHREKIMERENARETEVVSIEQFVSLYFLLVLFLEKWKTCFGGERITSGIRLDSSVTTRIESN